MSMSNTSRSRAGAAAALALAVGLLAAGCTAAPAPTPHPTVSSAAPTPALGCAELLPRDEAAAQLGLPAAELTDAPYEQDSAPASGATAVAMIGIARANSGILQCLWRKGTDNTGATAVSLSAAGDAASAFASYQPDNDDGLNDLAPAQLGDRAYLGCRTGESDDCRAEVLAGGSWFSLEVSPQPHDLDAFQTLARSIGASLSARPLPAATAPERPDCQKLLDPAVLATVGPLAAGVQDDLGPDGVHPGDGMDQLSLQRGGLTECDAVFSRGGVLLDTLSDDEASWTDRPPGADGSSITLSPVPGIGDRAVGGCADQVCELDVMIGKRWLIVEGLDANAALDTLTTITKGAVGALTAG